MNEELSRRIDTIESDIRELREMITKEQIAIESLRSIVYEHSKEIEKLGNVVAENSKSINQLSITMAKLGAKVEALVDKLNSIPKMIEDVRRTVDDNYQVTHSLLKQNESMTKTAINAIVRIVEISFIVFAGLKISGLI